MADNETFEDIFNNWNVLASNWKNKKTIYRYQVEELLDNGEIPTQKAMPFLAAAFKGNIQWGLRPPKPFNRDDSPLLKGEIALRVLYLESVNKIELKNTPKKHGDPTALQIAKEDTAAYYGLCVTKIEEQLKLHKKYATEMLKKIKRIEKLK